MITLTADEQEMVHLVATFTDERIRPRVREFETEDLYPAELIEEMKQLGVFGLLVPAEHGGVDVRTACFARVTEELARGWMSRAGAMVGHSVISYLIRHFGTPEQRAAYLPRMADGSLRATMALTEPSGGTDLQAMRTYATGEGNELIITGSKTWISNAEHADLIGLLCITDRAAEPASRCMSVVLVEPGDGLTVSGKIPKLGYRRIEACELTFDRMRVPASAVLGGTPGAGWQQMMRGLGQHACSVSMRPHASTPESAPTWMRGRRSCSPPRPRDAGRPWTRSVFAADTATPASTTSNATSAMPL